VTAHRQPFGRIVSDEEIHDALEYLRSSAVVIGDARQRLIKAGHLVKHVEALLFLASPEKTAEGKKAYAKCDKRWLAAVNEEAEAAGEFEKLKAWREAAAAKIEAWRSEQATLRGMRV
jgi:hypothetical protein